MIPSMEQIVKFRVKRMRNFSADSPSGGKYTSANEHIKFDNSCL